jgi:ABC-type lipoprotein release transport system permease subunit
MLSELTAFGLLPQRLTAWLAAAVGLITVLLATIGIYGITAHGIAQRRRQIGIRVALGAQRWQVLGMVVRHAISLTGAGAIVGLQRAASLDPVQALRSE